MQPRSLYNAAPCSSIIPKQNIGPVKGSIFYYSQLHPCQDCVRDEIHHLTACLHAVIAPVNGHRMQRISSRDRNGAICTIHTYKPSEVHPFRVNIPCQEVGYGKLNTLSGTNVTARSYAVQSITSSLIHIDALPVILSPTWISWVIIITETDCRSNFPRSVQRRP